MQTLDYYLSEDVRNLLKEHKVNLTNYHIDITNPQIDIIKMDEELSIEIKYSFSKQTDYKNKIVTISELNNIQRQRFCIAHAIGHYVYKHEQIKDTITKDQIKLLTNDDEPYFYELIERQANNFALKLLIPEKLVIKVRNDLEKNNKIINYKQMIHKLAEKFNVSYIGMEYRLRQLDKK